MTVAEQAQMVTVPEFAKALNVRRQTVYEWIDKGWVDARRLGSRTLRIPKSELERALNEGIEPREVPA